MVALYESHVSSLFFCVSFELQFDDLDLFQRMLEVSRKSTSMAFRLESQLIFIFIRDRDLKELETQRKYFFQGQEKRLSEDG